LFPKIQADGSVEDDVLLEDLIKDKFLESDQTNTVVFVSDDVRHRVMSFFVRYCLKTEDDYENYINLSSADSLLEYVRTWWYSPSEGERCMYLPQKMEQLLIMRLGINSIQHVMVKDRADSDWCHRYLKIRDRISEICT
jgi:hypothetical protein